MNRFFWITTSVGSIILATLLLLMFHGLSDSGPRVVYVDDWTTCNSQGGWVRCYDRATGSELCAYEYWSGPYYNCRPSAPADENETRDSSWPDSGSTASTTLTPTLPSTTFTPTPTKPPNATSNPTTPTTSASATPSTSPTQPSLPGIQIKGVASLP